jgi:division protein CdvB (Snf7/Vps24/ESCRT-III family)
MADRDELADFFREHVPEPTQAEYYANAFRSVTVPSVRILAEWYRSLQDRDKLTESLRRLDALSDFARPALEDALIQAFGPPGKNEHR